MEKFERYSEQDLIHDLFAVGYSDWAIAESTSTRTRWKRRNIPMLKKW